MNVELVLATRMLKRASIIYILCPLLFLIRSQNAFVTSLASSIISGLLVGLLVQNFIGFEPYTVIIFLFVGIYDGFRRMWKISKKLEQDQ